MCDTATNAVPSDDEVVLTPLLFANITKVHPLLVGLLSENISILVRTYLTGTTTWALRACRTKAETLSALAA